MKVLKCNSCGATVLVVDDCNCKCGISCCDEEMREVTINSLEASFEKHMPKYNVVGDKIEVVVPHVMEEEHYIEFIALEHDNVIEKVSFKPGDVLRAEFNYIKGSTIYSLCNKHGLWKTLVE